MWTFPWNKLSWHFCTMWDKLGWLNWSWRFLCEWLSSFNPKGFYPHMHGLAIYEREGLAIAQDWSLENSADSYVLHCLYFNQWLTTFFSIYHFLDRYSQFLILFHLTYMRLSWSSHLLLCLFLETLMFLIRTGLPILVELNDLVNSYNFPISNDPIQIVNFPTQIPDRDSHSPALLDFFPSSDTCICCTITFPPLGNFDVVVSVSIEFSPNSKRDAMLHCIAYDYSPADHLRDVPWRDIFKLLVLLVNFVSEFRLELMYISPTVNIRWSLNH